MVYSLWKLRQKVIEKKPSQLYKNFKILSFSSQLHLKGVKPTAMSPNFWTSLTSLQKTQPQFWSLAISLPGYSSRQILHKTSGSLGSLTMAADRRRLTGKMDIWLVARDVKRDALTDKMEVQREHIIEELDRKRLKGRIP